MLKSPTFTEKGTCENGDKGFLKLPMKISDPFGSITRDLYDLVGFTGMLLCTKFRSDKTVGENCNSQIR